MAPLPVRIRGPPAPALDRNLAQEQAARLAADSEKDTMTEHESNTVIPTLTVSSSTPGDFVVVDEGAYVIELADVSDVRMRGFGNTDPGKLECRAHLKIVGGDFDGAVIKQWMSLSAHTSSFMYTLVVALNGGDPLPEGTPLNIRDFLGRRCKALVNVTEKPSTREPGTMARWPKVVSVKALPKGEPNF